MISCLMDLIEKKMEDEHITVSELCTELDIDESIYYSWVNNSDLITVSKLRKIIDILHISGNEIMSFLC